MSSHDEQNIKQDIPGGKLFSTNGLLVIDSDRKGQFWGNFLLWERQGGGRGEQRGGGGARSVQICFTAADIAHIRFIFPPVHFSVRVCVYCTGLRKLPNDCWC